MTITFIPPIFAQPIKLFDANRVKRPMSAIPTTAGVYRIRVFKPDGQPNPLRRLIGDDPDGILDIGEAGDTKHTNLRWRVEAFQKAVLDGTTYHSAGLRFQYYWYKRHFPLETLYVDWVKKPDKAAAKKCEHLLLEAYRFRFLDFPSLNCKA